MTNRLFPVHRHSWDDVKAAMINARKGDLPWRDKRLFKPAYFAGEDVVEVANKAYQMYISDNALYGHTAFPSIGKYESEVVRMVLELLNAPDGAGGSVTSGGTETLTMAVKTARDWAREHKSRARQPEIVLPRTAHPAFNKAAHLLGVRVVRMTDSPDFRADIDGMARAINRNTIMLAGSAPPYPYGATDPIDQLSNLALEHDLWLHVDGCIGGMILPFARKLGFPIRDFDFDLPGVTSISVDIHKFGYANKGISTILLRDAALERYQRTTFDEWPAGIYSTPNIIGSRSGGAAASAWAVMNYLGEEGYLDTVRRMLAIRDRFLAGIRAIDGLEVWGVPDAYQFMFGSNAFDILAVADGMEDRGWLGGRAMEPPSILLMINATHESIIDDYMTDLAEVVKAVKAGAIKARKTDAVYAV